jgi:hypothetical protein
MNSLDRDIDGVASEGEAFTWIVHHLNYAGITQQVNANTKGRFNPP